MKIKIALKTNISTFFVFSFLLPSQFFVAQAMDPKQQPLSTSFVRYKPTSEPNLRLSINRAEKQLATEDWELLRLQKALENAQLEVDSAKEALRLKREERNELHKKVRARKKALQVIEPRDLKKKKIKVHHANNSPQNVRAQKRRKPATRNSSED